MRLRRLLAVRGVEVVLCTLYVNLEDRSRLGMKAFLCSERRGLTPSFLSRTSWPYAAEVCDEAGLGFY